MAGFRGGGMLIAESNVCAANLRGKREKTRKGCVFGA